MVKRGHMSETGLLYITYSVQFVPGVCHGRPEELMQEAQARYQPQL